jgi:hypothetical protein
MKRPRPATVAGTIVGALLAVLAAHAMPGCSTLPPYIGVGFHWTTTPPTPQPSSSVVVVPAQSAASRP